MKKILDAIRKSSHVEVAAGILAGITIAIAATVWYPQHAEKSAHSVAPVDSGTQHSLQSPNPAATAPAKQPARFADVGRTPISADARFIADWVADSGDAQGMSFVIIDKKRARVHVFDANARLLGASPVLLGIAPGDDTVPGIGDKPLSQVRFEERTTPAGRFVGERGHNARGEDVVWIDYDAAVSMHRVLTTNPAEHRLERLATPRIDDNRVSFGCVNVPIAFYEQFIRPTFAQSHAIIYVLPDVKTLQQVFTNAYDVAVAHGA